MATRTVLTKFAAELDASYKSVQRDLQNSNAVLNSELKKLNAEYKNNKDSVEYLTKSLNIQQRKILGQEEAVEELRKTYEAMAKEMGDGSEATMKYAAKLNNAEAALIDMKNEVKDTESALEKAKDETKESADAFEDLAVETTGLGDVVGDLANKLGIDLPDGITKSLNGFGQLGPAVAISVGALVGLASAIVDVEDKLKSITLESAAYADDILTMSNNTSISTTTLQEWSYAAELMDVSVDTMTGSMEKMIRNMDNAREGTGDAAEAFETLGVSITNADGTLRSAEDV